MKISSQVGSETEAAGPDFSNQLKKSTIPTYLEHMKVKFGLQNVSLDGY